ncbi:hypothetical protein PACILC2_09620 [Paenibacillus cisolokensis]|uniref:Transposase n=1 Tax=Paenibacillus cisolokensis TaxID=1658519 RepID=A0ABQ4N2G7_9BACL|nr:hypothetical protein [Paenibacillus cisolokensis]GIQ62394.1 hypothetical protein PACILC2_09620 [Paenibacillus cisolokensis]
MRRSLDITEMVEQLGIPAGRYHLWLERNLDSRTAPLTENLAKEETCVSVNETAFVKTASGR